MKFFASAALTLGALFAGAGTAGADEPFIVCPDGHSGIATTVTSCEFAHNVRTGYLGQRGGSQVFAYSPVTGGIYLMSCEPGFVSTLNNGTQVTSVRCVGGNDAVVIVW